LTTLALSVLLLTLSGCGSGGMGSVSGQVTLDGKALGMGTVTFHPAQDGSLAVGQIGPDGRYELLVASEASVAPGDYVVTVVAAEPLPKAKLGEPEPLPKLLVPSRYTTTATSGLKFTVKPGSQTIDLPLESGSSK
jgi:hypothetical protein